MPSNKVLEEKKQIVETLADKMQNAVAGVLVDYKGINVEDDTKLRAELRQSGVQYSVIKNTLARLAVDKAGLSELTGVLEGTTALAVSDDLVAGAKILCNFAKTHDNFKIKAGFVEGKVLDENGVKELSALPSKEVLVARMLAGFNAPITGFVNVLNGNIRGLVVALNAIREQAEKAS